MSTDISMYFLSLVPSFVAFYTVKRWFDDRAAVREQEREIANKALRELQAMNLDELPKRIEKFERALTEAIKQMFDFARITQKDAAEKAGAVARGSRK